MVPELQKRHNSAGRWYRKYHFWSSLESMQRHQRTVYLSRSLRISKLSDLLQVRTSSSVNSRLVCGHCVPIAYINQLSVVLYSLRESSPQMRKRTMHLPRLDV